MDPKPLRAQHLEWDVVIVDRLRQVFGLRIRNLQCRRETLIPSAPEEGTPGDPPNP